MALQQLLESHEVFAIESIAALRENSLRPAADLLLGCDLIFSHDLSEQRPHKQQYIATWA